MIVHKFSVSKNIGVMHYIKVVDITNLIQLHEFQV